MVPGRVRLAPISGLAACGRAHERRLVGEHERIGAERARQRDRLRAFAAEIMPRVAVAVDEAIDVPQAAKMRQGRGPIR